MAQSHSNTRRVIVDSCVGQKLKLRRSSLRLTVGDLSERLGVSEEQLEAYEKGLVRISPTDLAKISEILSVNVAWFFTHWEYLPLQEHDIIVGEEFDDVDQNK